MDETSLIECIDECYMVFITDLIINHFLWMSENSVCKGYTPWQKMHYWGWKNSTLLIMC